MMCEAQRMPNRSARVCAFVSVSTARCPCAFFCFGSRPSAAVQVKRSSMRVLSLARSSFLRVSGRFTPAGASPRGLAISREARFEDCFLRPCPREGSKDARKKMPGRGGGVFPLWELLLLRLLRTATITKRGPVAVGGAKAHHVTVRSRAPHGTFE